MPEETPELEAKVITPFDILMTAPLIRREPAQIAETIEIVWNNVRGASARRDTVMCGGSISSAVLIACCLESEMIRNTLLNPNEINSLLTMAQNAQNNARTRFTPNVKVRAIWDGAAGLTEGY